jgi:hypothetical protein
MITLFYARPNDVLLMKRLTPELTERAFNAETIQVLDESQANSRSG